jgi:glucose-1-phosphate thymidylyltransferase
MKCVILAAGYATRLYPLTENYPKSLLKVLDKTILDWLIDDLNEKKYIDEYILVSNHKYINQFKEYIRKKKNIIPISIIDDGTTSNDNRLGAVNDINLVIDKYQINEDLMVIAGDNVLDFSLNKFIDYFNEKHNTVIMRYYEKNLDKIKKR